MGVVVRFNEPIQIPSGFLQVLGAALIAVAPGVLNQITFAVPLKFFRCHRCLDGIDTFNTPARIVSRGVD